MPGSPVVVEFTFTETVVEPVPPPPDEPPPDTTEVVPPELDVIFFTVYLS